MLTNSSMRLARFVPLALTALLGAAAATALTAQEDQPSKGKIGDVERSADNAKQKGNDGGDDGGGWFIEGVGSPFRAMAVMLWEVHPRDTGQGYLRYPYAAGSNETFKPIIFNFHGYPWLIHRLTYRRTNHKNLHVRGYKEKGNINTPLDLAIRNQIDRFTIAMDVIDRVPALRATGAHAKEKLRVMQLEAQAYAYENGIDKPELDGWTWPGNR